MPESTFSWLCNKLKQGAQTTALAVSVATPSLVSYLATQSAVNEVLHVPDDFIDALRDPGECDSDPVNPSTWLGFAPFLLSAGSFMLGFIAQEYQGSKRAIGLLLAIASNSGVGELAKLLGRSHGKELLAQLMDCGIFDGFDKLSAIPCLPSFLTSLPPSLLCGLVMAVCLGTAGIAWQETSSQSAESAGYRRLRADSDNGDIEMVPVTNPPDEGGVQGSAPVASGP